MAIRAIPFTILLVVLGAGSVRGRTSIPLFVDPSDWTISDVTAADYTFLGNEVTIDSFGEGPEGRVTRQIDVRAGDRLSLQIDYLASGGDCQDSNCDIGAGGSLSVPDLTRSWRAPFGEDEIGEPIVVSVGDSFPHEFTFSQAGSHELAFAVWAVSTQSTISVSGVLITVPEPGTVGLALSAVLGLMAMPPRRDIRGSARPATQ